MRPYDHAFKVVHPLIIVCTHPFLLGGLNLQPIFQKEGGDLTGHQLLEGVCWERGGCLLGKRGLTLFREGVAIFT